jgi:hypothetical protein
MLTDFSGTMLQGVEKTKMAQNQYFASNAAELGIIS